MAGNVPKSRGMFQYVFKHLMDSFKVGKVLKGMVEMAHLNFILMTSNDLHK